MVTKRIIYTFFIGMFSGALVVLVAAPSIISPQKQPHSLFVYGTLQNNLIRYYACRCLVPELPVTLPEYEKVGLNIVPTANSSVSGSIISVSTSQLERIDAYENTPQKYTRETISINGETHWVYIKNE
jgi:gamma-glutamylcyclotransferase (GGCT)/AIG2-like uncharacterized protein YtfP